MLRGAGYAVTEAGSGEDAVELAISARPRLVVMDVRMPGMSASSDGAHHQADPRGTGVMLSATDSAEQCGPQ